jgi:hypothetical protein
MKSEFEEWLVKKEDKSPTIAHRYSLAINLISKHYSEQIKKETELQKIDDMVLIMDLINEYGINGKFFEIGNKGKGSYRNALSAYLRFLKYKKLFKGREDTEKRENEILYKHSVNILLNNHIKYFFPDYYEIEKRVYEKEAYILLENVKENNLLIILIIEEVADIKAFIQIADIHKSLTDELPGKKIKGVIIGAEIDQSLVNSCFITDKIEIMKYKINVKLEKISTAANCT